MYGPLEQVCAYNPDIEKCKDFSPEHRESERPPNVVMIAVESFSPSPMFINKNVTISDKKVTDGPLFNDYYLPNLARLSEEGISFSGMSS